MRLDSACLFLIFNRPDTTSKVFEVIRKVRPEKLYIAGDGARTYKEGEAEKVALTRDIINKVDWNCDLNTLFQDKNLGCKKAVSGAITWFLEHEAEGIIIEDDCVPSQSFFYFCDELLNKYRYDTRIMAISGNNFQKTTANCYSYCFSRYPHIWGWATWKRAWKYWDGELSSWPDIKKKKILHSIFYKDHKLCDCWANIFDACYEGKIDTWDYQWAYSCFLQNGLTILPEVNLVSNIGFRSDATHTSDANDKYANMHFYDMKFPLQHPPYITRNLSSDSNVDAYLVKNNSFNATGKHSSLLKSIEKLYAIIYSIFPHTSYKMK